MMIGGQEKRIESKAENVSQPSSKVTLTILAVVGVLMVDGWKKRRR
jgi:hypothetical protein